MLQAVFARPVGIFNNWFNKVVAYCTRGSFCHSEFVFTWSEEQADAYFCTLDTPLSNSYKRYIEDGKLHICFYILWGDVLSYRLLKYQHNNPFYRIADEAQSANVPINVSMQEEQKMVSFLLNQCGKSYDYTGALMFFVPLRNSMTEYDQYYCSELMVCTLQQVRQLPGVNASGVTPNHLYKLLTN
jgi:hypothetical protein|tara:strand:+ start:77 stop:634 length:558 start_codon:yes stop_codon:yes gene_type:complete